MKLIQTSFFSGLITIIKLSTGFITSKVVAIYVGPVGVALVGAFSNFITIALTFGNGAINTGVVKYTAEYKERKYILKELFTTSLRISLLCSIITGFILILFASYFSNWILTSDEYLNPIRVLGITIIFYSINTLLISVLNGLGEIRTYALVNTVGSILGLIFSIILIYYYRITGALYALVTFQSAVLIVTLFIIRRKEWFTLQNFNFNFNRGLALKLGQFSLMAIVSALTIPVSQIVLRNLIISEFGIDYGGYWQAMMRISDGYLMILSTALSTYYLPKLSSLDSEVDIRVEIINGFKIIIPITLLGCILVYILRFRIINILYTPNFVQMETLFFWQLVGDFLKICAWILAHLMLAKSMTKIYIITEIIFSIIYVMISYNFLKYFGFEGTAIGFAVNYLIYFITMIVIFKKLLFKRNKTII